MKDLVVYYSLEGNTEYVTDKIKNCTGADTLCIIPKKAYHDKGLLSSFGEARVACISDNQRQDLIAF